MLCYREMTFCSADCLNVGCSRNKERLPESIDDFFPVAWSDFSECCSYYEPKDATDDEED